MRKYFFLVTKFILGSLTLTAVGIQFIADSKGEDFSAVNFFSYFTTESSIIAGFVLLSSAFFIVKGTPSQKLDLFRGAIVVYLIIAGLVYKLLLADLPDTTGTTITWVNDYLHYFMPFAIVFDWIADPPTNKIEYKHILLWLIFPLVYLGFSIIRGLLMGWYPYSFLDPDTAGILEMIQYILVIALAGVFLSVLTIWVSRSRQR